MDVNLEMNFNLALKNSKQLENVNVEKEKI